MKASQLPYRVPRFRGANVIASNPQRMDSKDGSKWACGRNVKRALPDHRYDSVEVWTLKQRVKGKAAIVNTGCSRDAAELWCGLL